LHIQPRRLRLTDDPQLHLWTRWWKMLRSLRPVTYCYVGCSLMDNCVATGNIIIDKENQDLIPVMLKMNPRKERRTVVL
jgi:hypothetical protein